MSWHWIGISIAIALVTVAIIWPIARIPELDLFPDGAERRQALRAARKTVFKFKRRVQIALPMPCLFLVEAILDALGITFGKAIGVALPIAALVWWLLGMHHNKTAMREAIRHQLAQHGRCVSCGYNLQGNESGYCPECGTTITISIGV